MAFGSRYALTMNIVVTLKQVQDPNATRTSLRIGPDAKSIVLAAGGMPILSGYDANALEEALRLRENSGGTVTAISVGQESTKDVLRRAIAMGADQALHVLGPTGIDCDSSTTASLLAAAIRSLPAIDLVLSGRQASDTDGALTHLLLAAQLGLAAVSPVKAIRTADSAALIVDRITEGGVQRLRVPTPAVIGVSNEINKPRSPSLKGVATAKRASIPTVTPESLGVGAMEPAVRLVRLSFPPAVHSSLELVSASSPEDLGKALADRLHHEGMI